MMEYLSPLLGGVLLGVASSLLLLVSGRITGISGIVASAREREPWRWAFLVGMVLGGFLIVATAPSMFDTDVSSSTLQLLVSGLLVGIGTRMAGGCTSGHGVCGLPRVSPRSLIAVPVFIASGAATVVALRLFDSLSAGGAG